MHNYSVADEIAKMAALRDEGVLSEAEFDKQRKRVLRASAPRARVTRVALTVAIVSIAAVVAFVATILPKEVSSVPSGPVTLATATQSQIAAVLGWAVQLPASLAFGEPESGATGHTGYHPR
jgi:hypothetical protein